MNSLLIHSVAIWGWLAILVLVAAIIGARYLAVRIGERRLEHVKEEIRRRRK